MPAGARHGWRGGGAGAPRRLGRSACADVPGADADEILADEINEPEVGDADEILAGGGRIWGRGALEGDGEVDTGAVPGQTHGLNQATAACAFRCPRPRCPVVPVGSSPAHKQAPYGPSAVLQEQVALMNGGLADGKDRTAIAG